MPKTSRKKTRSKAKSNRLLITFKQALNRPLFVVFLAIFVVAGAYIIVNSSRADTSTLDTGATALTSHLVIFKSGVAGKCLSDWNNSSTPGSKVAIADCNGSDAQTWLRYSDYTIHNNGLCLATADKSIATGTNIVMAVCDGRATEQWATGNNTISNLLIVKGTGLCIHSPNFTYANGTQQQLWQCRSPQENDQQWNMVNADTCGTGTTPSDAQCIAKNMLSNYGWSISGQFDCLQSLWNRESGWNRRIQNPTSGAFGIAQALGHGGNGTGANVVVEYPGGGTSNGPVYVNEYPVQAANAEDATAQIRWGLGYIKNVYDTPCNAWAHEQQFGWYTQLAP